MKTLLFNCKIQYLQKKKKKKNFILFSDQFNLNFFTLSCKREIIFILEKFQFAHISLIKQLPCKNSKYQLYLNYNNKKKCQMALWTGFSVQFWNGTPSQIPTLSLVTTSNMTF